MQQDPADPRRGRTDPARCGPDGRGCGRDGRVSRPRARRLSSGRVSCCRVPAGRRVRRKRRRGRGWLGRRCHRPAGRPAAGPATGSHPPLWRGRCRCGRVGFTAASVVPTARISFGEGRTGPTQDRRTLGVCAAGSVEKPFRSKSRKDGRLNARSVRFYMLRPGTRTQGDDSLPESVRMTCSLLRSKTAVTVVVQDWPFRDCTTMGRRPAGFCQEQTPF